MELDDASFNSHLFQRQIFPTAMWVSLLFKIMMQTGFMLQLFDHSEAIVGMHFPNRYKEYFK